GHGFHAAVGQRIGPLVLDVAVVSAHPAPFDLVARLRGVQRLPQVGILDRLPGGGLPAAQLPAVYPLADALLHVLAVGMHDHFAWTIERIERLDHGFQFHAVVGGGGLAAEDFLFVLAHDQQRAPAAAPRIPLASAVGINVYFAHCTLCLCILLVAGTPAVAGAFWVFHAGPIRRMALTRLIACTIYTAPNTGQPLVPALSMKAQR